MIKKINGTKVQELLDNQTIPYKPNEKIHNWDASWNMVTTIILYMTIVVITIMILHKVFF
jgi:hypothetical protein